METLLQQGQPNLVNNKTEIRAPIGRTRSLITDILALLLAASVGYTFQTWLILGGMPYMFLAAAALFSLMATLNSFLPKTAEHRYWIILAEAALIAVWFYRFPLIYLIIAALLLLICLMWGEAELHSVLNRQLEVGFFHPAKSKLGKTVTGITVFGIIIFASISTGPNPIPESFFDGIYSPAAKLVAGFYPDINFQGSAAQFAHDLAGAQVKNVPEFAKLPPAAQNKALDQGTSQILSSVGVTSDQAKEPLSVVAYGYITELLSAARERIGTLFILIWVLLLFILLRSTLIIADYMLLIIGWLLFEVILASNFVHLAGETCTKEIISY